MGNPLDGTAFEFLRWAWWGLHIPVIMMLFYLGHRYWPKRR
ncbi:hypothetical protein HM1_0421 [Heliomicrobium modesticaldum Ice1]|uniref:Uncharacterized protein n=1 Tax=Heliobacterium modesticaldum (strain ATCC 51547 / Ice1) TaxID=498761 RepID=B0TF55_HELMI|nr:hypothetical protein [Heliomicrobium modesticaldum]ABZ83038.1 hypothetical protein HM1_0421 [Heliomicrobium modesticaldum Ice1]